MNIIKYQLYLLQIEDYNIVRYWKLLFKRGYFYSKQALRNNLVWTKKAKLIFGFTIFYWLLCFLFIIFKFSFKYTLLWVVISFLIIPIFYTISLIVISPFDYLAKRYLIRKVKKIISSTGDLKIIGIAGSYGKTTMKNTIKEILSTKFKVLSTPQSVNTPIGIANWLIKNYTKDVDFLIIEMGEHYKGDIKYLCSVVPPDIAIMTGVNEAHIERLGSIENAIATIFEVVQNANKDAVLLLNADDINIQNNYQKYTKDKTVLFYSHQNSSLSNVKIDNKRFNTATLSWLFDFEGFGSVEVSVIGEYIIGNIVAGVILARELGLSDQEIKDGILNIKPIKHRLYPIRSKADVLVIDDSYNGNFHGVIEAINVLSRFKNKRKLFITPGLVETGQEAARVHQYIGNRLANVVDVVILVRNSVTPYVFKGLKDSGFDQNNIIWFNIAKEAHDALSKILKPNDVILFQNDWGDQYL